MIHHQYAWKIVEIKTAQIRTRSQYCYHYLAREVENLILKSYTMQRALGLYTQVYFGNPIPSKSSQKFPRR